LAKDYENKRIDKGQKIAYYADSPFTRHKIKKGGMNMKMKKTKIIFWAGIPLTLLLIAAGCVYDAKYVSTENVVYNEGSVRLADSPKSNVLDVRGRRLWLEVYNSLPDDSIQLATIDARNLSKLGAEIVDPDGEAEGTVIIYHFTNPESTHEYNSENWSYHYSSEDYGRYDTVELNMTVELKIDKVLKSSINRSLKIRVNTKNYHSWSHTHHYRYWWRDGYRYSTEESYNINKAVFDGMRELWNIILNQ